MTDEKARVRFAPSPTGKLHIGGARTAIFNWAFARANGGDFILRIEDTDPERSTEENVRVILDALKWLGLDWDEGPGVEGPCGPYFQMDRLDTYAEALELLKERGAVYPCFCTKEALDAKRAAAEKAEGGYGGYDRTCRDIDPAVAQERIAAGEPHVWRLKVPDDHGPVAFDDAVYGPVSFPIEAMDDAILVRSDGSPTYNFAVVCDDSNMGITHVIRGDDHLSNTPRQILIYEALGRATPTFGHLSMILGPDGKKLSKRHGATSVEEYRERGYLPDAMVNFLALLGWSLDGETTIVPRDVLCREFSLSRITKKDAIFDEKKLDWMDGVYIRELDAATWVDLAAPWLVQAAAMGLSVPSGVNVVPTPSSDADSSSLDATEGNRVRAADLLAQNRTWFEGLFPLVSERLVRFDEIPAKLQFLFWGESCQLDEKSMNKVLLKDEDDARRALAACFEVLANQDNPWEAESLEQQCRELAEPLGLKLKNLLQPLRVAVCGNMVSPPLFESMVMMDRSKVLARIRAVMDEVL